MIDGAAFRAPVFGEVDFADAVAKPRRFAIRQRRQRDLLQVVAQLGGVTVDMRLVFL